MEGMNMDKMGGDKMCASGKCCPCPHHKMKPFLLLILGVVLLLNALAVVTWSFVYITASILLILLAIGKMCKCCKGMCASSMMDKSSK